MLTIFLKVFNSTCILNVFKTLVVPKNRWSQDELKFLVSQFGNLKRPPTFSEIREAQRVIVTFRDLTLLDTANLITCARQFFL